MPWALLGLFALPVIWWLLRLKESEPKRVVFSANFILQSLVANRKISTKTSPWIMLFRLILVGLIILGMAGPLWNSSGKLIGNGPIYIVIDNGWTASNTWASRQTVLNDILGEAERSGRPVVVIPTALSADGSVAFPHRLSAADARRLTNSLQPHPWHTNRSFAIDTFLKSRFVNRQERGDVIWLSDGLEEPRGINGPKSTMSEVIQMLDSLGPITIYLDSPNQFPILLMAPELDGAALRINARRSRSSFSRGIQVLAFADDGEILGQLPLVFSPGSEETTGRLEIPSQKRIKLSRLKIRGMRSAGAVILIDGRWLSRPVGLLSGSANIAPQPLLSSEHYLRQAISSFTVVHKGGVAELLQRGLAVLVIDDSKHLDDAEINAIENWIERGGVLLRFAGPRLARGVGASDTLLPVQIRQGGRTIGGSLSWQRPESLASFTTNSPFFDLTIPDDVTVRRQVLAKPSSDLANKTWARLADGTPLVTAVKKGKGWKVLVHTTANAEWSNLPFSGLYISMLQRLILLSEGVEGGNRTAPLFPIENLNAFGEIIAPLRNTLAIPGSGFEKAHVSRHHPPGFYGTDTARRALNLSQNISKLSNINNLPSDIKVQRYEKARVKDLKSWVLGIAALFFIIDILVSMWIRGLFGVFSRKYGKTILILTVLGMPAYASDDFAIKNSLVTRIAFLITGDSQVDLTSKAGLSGLTLILRRRTAVELGAPQGINPAVDELSLFPLVYWPVVPGYSLPANAAARVMNYLRNGGTILFDTRDEVVRTSDGTLTQLSQDLKIPLLVPVPGDHVLTKSYYLLKNFPGRWSGGLLWIEKAGERINDGVSPVIAGSHDWAAAWAVDDHHRPLFAVVPGGERQREMAYRFGVNLVMYTLTGNYKADQVHIPAIIERLGE